jgi:hypothetical protein
VGAATFADNKLAAVGPPAPIERIGAGRSTEPEVGASACPATATTQPLSVLGSESAHQIYDEADQQNQSDTPATNGGPAKIKATAAKEEKKYDHEK